MEKTVRVHPQEQLVQSFPRGDVTVELVQWPDSIWCGKLGYAADGSDEPDVEKLLQGYMALDFSRAALAEGDGEACFSLQYLSSRLPSGVMFARPALSESQPEEFDILKLPGARYLRVKLDGKTAAYLGCEPWQGGTPPHEWLGERLGPELGFTYSGNDAVVLEYYGDPDPETGNPRVCYLYVSVSSL